MPRSTDTPIDEVSGVEERPQNRREWGGPLRSLVLPVLIVATIVAVLLYVEGQRGGGATQDGLGVVQLPPELAPADSAISTEIGGVAPDFILETPDGATLRFSDLRGQPVLVNFWASWCAPCREEMPEIVRAYEAHRGQGLVVLGVNLQENRDQITSFAEDFGMTFPIVVDHTGQVADAWRIGGPVEGIPASYFIDAGGVVRARVFGTLTEEKLAENLALIGVRDGDS